MHSNHATWETGLVIPETKKTTEELMLESFLRIEALLERLLGNPELIRVSGDVTDMIADIAPTETPFTKAVKKAKGK